ncbi:hypothetical protein BDF21DRAFT_400326 [Thamnidium elegans]|nr:hypothetical protein BDF21DRAFT_400326 [Thamnidium elegans]
MLAYKQLVTSHSSANQYKNTYQYLYRIAYKHHDSTENLNIPYTNDQVLQQKFDGIMTYMCHFENVKSLRLLKGDRSSPVVYFDTLLNSCITLEKISIEYFSPLYPPTMVQTYYPSMRRLEIVLYGISVEYLEYIMVRFVNITVLHIRVMKSTYLKDYIIDHFIQQKLIPFVKTLSQASLMFQVFDIAKYRLDYFQTKKKYLH